MATEVQNPSEQTQTPAQATVAAQEPRKSLTKVTKELLTNNAELRDKSAKEIAEAVKAIAGKAPSINLIYTLRTQIKGGRAATGTNKKNGTAKKPGRPRQFTAVAQQGPSVNELVNRNAALEAENKRLRAMLQTAIG